MCIAIRELMAEAREDGISEGISQGISQGASQTLVKNIENLIDNMKLDVAGCSPAGDRFCQQERNEAFVGILSDGV